MADNVVRAGTRLLGTSKEVVYTPSGGAAQTIRAVFDRAHVDVDPATDRPIVSTQPVAGIRLADLDTAPREGDEVTVGGTAYTVHRVEVDGQAGADLFLHEVPA